MEEKLHPLADKGIASHLSLNAKQTKLNLKMVSSGELGVKVSGSPSQKVPFAFILCHQALCQNGVMSGKFNSCCNW